MNQTQTRELLQKLGMAPTKALGQNYLVDENLARWMVEQLQPQPGEHVVEIGPGMGSLTEIVLRHPARVSMTLIEFDRKTAQYWRDHPESDRIEIIEADAFKVNDLQRFFAYRPVKFLSNLPYKGGAKILAKWCCQPSPFSRFVVTLQREVADRVAAEPGSSEYGTLALTIQKDWIPRIGKNLGAMVFWPQPDVRSATLILEPRPGGELPSCYRNAFDQLITLGFSQRRKKLRNLVPPEVRTDWPRASRHVGFDPETRAERLTLHQWIELARFWKPAPDMPAQDVHEEIFDVVDDRNRPIAQKTRHEVHRDSLCHRAVHIFALSRRGDRILLQKRGLLKDKAPGKWDSSAAGHLDAGEDYLTAAQREIVEELGPAASDPAALTWNLGIPACPETGQEFVALFTAPLRQVPREGFPLQEIEFFEAFHIDTVRRWIARKPDDFASGFLRCFEAHFGHGNPG
jgi:16S rRNA (adenine1518-N6/adenine1519-N6)-dimethyltransferase